MRIANAEATIQHYVSQFDMSSFLNDALLSRLQVFAFPIHSSVFIEEEEQDYLYFLVHGQVQCTHYHPDGKLAVIAIDNPFAAIGDIEVLSEERIHSNVTATQDTIMLGIPSADVQRYGADDPRFLRFLIDQLREKLYDSNTLKIGQIQPVINRLAIYILTELASGEDTLILPEKEVLASLLGTTSRHLNRIFKKLVEEGVLSAGYPRVQILDKSALQDLLV